jgi:hypothetical protein
MWDPATSVFNGCWGIFPRVKGLGPTLCRSYWMEVYLHFSTSSWHAQGQLFLYGWFNNGSYFPEQHYFGWTSVDCQVGTASLSTHIAWNSCVKGFRSVTFTGTFMFFWNSGSFHGFMRSIPYLKISFIVETLHFEPAYPYSNKNPASKSATK